MIRKRWTTLAIFAWPMWVMAAVPTTSTSRPTTEETFPSLRPWAAEREAQLDKELAERIIQRQDAAPDQLPGLNLQIDLRIIDRYFLQVLSATARSESQTQIVATLRSQEISTARTELEELQKSAPAPDPRQIEAMGRLHQLTFKLGEVKEAGDLDVIARQVGTELLVIGMANPPDPATLPVMRPSVLASTTQPSSQPAIRSLSELSTEITRTAVSVSLRKQLLAIAHAAADAGPGKEQESLELRQALTDGVELARGLSSTTAFSAAAREGIENQLAEGLALVSDPRTRLAGRQRIRQLDEYRTVMDRLATAKLPPQVRAALEPALGYAQTHADEGQTVLNLVQDYIQINQQFDLDSRADVPVVPNLRTSIEQVSQQFAAARQTFLAAANQLGARATVQTLQSQIADLRELADLHGILARMQQTYQTLNAYHPRPFGGIEGHVQRAAVAASSAAHSSLRAEGIAYLTELTRLAKLSNTITQNSLADIPPEVLQNYAGVSVNDFTAKCNVLISDLANQFANGRATDRHEIARLDAVEVMIDGLRQAQLIEQQLQSTTTLLRWADWTLTSEQMRGLVASYQQLLSGAFAGFVKDDREAIEDFVLGRHAYLPILDFLARDAQYSDFCSRLPEGFVGTVARLMTPMAKEPFSLERYVSFAMSVSNFLSSTDPQGSEAARQAAIQRISQDISPEESK
jgi:hypothetical protein